MPSQRWGLSRVDRRKDMALNDHLREIDNDLDTLEGRIPDSVEEAKSEIGVELRAIRDEVKNLRNETKDSRKEQTSTLRRISAAAISVMTALIISLVLLVVNLAK